MQTSTTRLFLLIATLLLGACSGARPSADRARQISARNVIITQDQLRQYRDAYQAVQALRPIWLRARGTDSARNPSQVWVYIDGSRLGGVGALRNLAATDIGEIRFFDAMEATQRWGIGHGAGVIAVTTRMR